MVEVKRYHVLPLDPFFDDQQDNAGRSDEQMIGRVFTDDCKQITYEYDFGDSWEHLIKLEKRTPGGDQDHIPICLAGENAAPIDDTGGIDGYYDWLEALRDEKHASHEEAVEWLGEDFDPARFDLEEVNWRLKQAFKPIPKKPRKPRKKRE